MKIHARNRSYKQITEETPNFGNVDKDVTILQDSFCYWYSSMTVNLRQNHSNRPQPLNDEECGTIRKQSFTFLDLVAKTGTKFCDQFRNKSKHLIYEKAKSYTDSMRKRLQIP